MSRPTLCTLPTAANWACAALLAMALGCSHLLGPDDHSTEQAQADELQAAQRQALADQRREAAAAQLCMRFGGPNAAHRWSASGELQCTTKRGHPLRAPTHVAQVSL